MNQGGSVEGPEVSSISDRRMLMSVRRLSEVFEMARETVAKRLADHGVQAADRRHGHPVYAMKDAAIALLGQAPTDEDGEFDPRRLPPDKRSLWYQSEMRRLEVEMRCGQLVAAAEHESSIAEIVKDLVQFLTTLGDQLERDCALSPEQVESVNASVDRMRVSLYQKLTTVEEDAVSAA